MSIIMRRDRHTERQVNYGATLAALGGDVVHSPVEARQNGGGGSLVALEDLDGDDVGLRKVLIMQLYMGCRVN